MEGFRTIVHRRGIGVARGNGRVGLEPQSGQIVVSSPSVNGFCVVVELALSEHRVSVGPVTWLPAVAHRLNFAA